MMLMLDLEFPSGAIGVDDVEDGAGRPDGANSGVGRKKCRRGACSGS
jgi:hypothetical protein